MTPRQPWQVLLLAGLAASAVARAGETDLDETRAAWRYRREVRVAAQAGFVALALPPELAAHAQADLQDLRLVSPDGSEVPYVVDRLIERAVPKEWAGRLVDSRQERRRESGWTVDLGELQTFDLVRLDVPDGDFAKRLRLELSEDGRAWRLARGDAGIFDRMWGERVHHTRIELTAPVTARFLRVTADDRRSRPITITGATVSATRRRDEVAWSREAKVVPLGSGSISRYRLELASALRFERLMLASADPAFRRRVVLREESEVNGRRQSRVLGDGTLFHVALPEEGTACESLRLDVARPSGGELILEVHDADSPPLRNLRVTVGGVSERLLFPVTTPGPILYYGNARTRAPLYDLGALEERLSAGLAFAAPQGATTLGDEVENPRFRPAPPLPFAPLVGAPLDASRWQTLRALTLAGGDDIYTLTLAARDLALLRHDLGDLRVVDASGRQVPFIVEPGASEERVPLTIERRNADAAVGQAGVSRYRLRLPVVEGAASSALPLSTLTLVCKEPFFSRRARLSAPPAGGSDGGRPQPLFSGTLARAADEKPPIAIGLDGSRLAEMELEIDEGDNAPLTLERAEAVIAVPRIAFKAASGSYRVLFGNREAEPPRYDLAALRRDVLCYSAQAAKAGPAEPNPAFRRGVSEYLRAAKPTALIWIVLVVAVAALLYLTLRVLRQAGTTSS